MADAAREDGEIQHGKDSEPDFGKKYPLENRSAVCRGMLSTCTLPGLWLGLDGGCSLALPAGLHSRAAPPAG